MEYVLYGGMLLGVLAALLLLRRWSYYAAR